MTFSKHTAYPFYNNNNTKNSNNHWKWFTLQCLTQMTNTSPIEKHWRCTNSRERPSNVSYRLKFLLLLRNVLTSVQKSKREDIYQKREKKTSVSASGQTEDYSRLEGVKHAGHHFSAIFFLFVVLWSHRRKNFTESQLHRE